MAGDLAALARIEREVAACRLEAAEAIDCVIRLEALVSSLGLPCILERISAARARLTKLLPAWSHARFLAESQEVDRRLEAGDLPGALQGALAVHEKAEQAEDAYLTAAYHRAEACFRLGRVLRHNGHADEALGMLDKARTRFAELAAAGNNAAARMESVAICEKGDVLRALGRLDDAAEAYDESAKRADVRGATRDAAVSKGQLGTVRKNQRRFAEALVAYEEAKRSFETLGEPVSVATSWHQIGMVHAEAGNFDAAEYAYRQALALQSPSGDRAGEASTLNALGVLYEGQDRLTEAVSFYRQSAERFHESRNALNESRSLSNIGNTLHMLRRFDEARDTILAGIVLAKPYGHVAELWKRWASLANVERDSGRPKEAAEARAQAIAAYRAYRDDGGEPMDGATQFIARFGKVLRTSGPDAARAMLPDPAEIHAQFAPTLRALRAIVAGSRDPALAEDPEHDPRGAVELEILLASLPPA